VATARGGTWTLCRSLQSCGGSRLY
jgi:hypothetical protein